MTVNVIEEPRGDVLKKIRSQFPALSSGTVFFDNPGGTQVPRQVINRMCEYLQHYNANHAGVFRTSVHSDEILDEAYRGAADFLNAASPREIVFGANMTTLTFTLSRSLAKWLKTDDEIIVTRLDHDANISPWLLIAQDAGAKVCWVDIHMDDCTLLLEDLERLLSSRTKLVAVGYASNAVGAINPVRRIADMVHAHGALLFVDAVHYAPHGPIDVQELACDFLVCSPYKFFGPHMGILYGRGELLEKLPAYKVRPADLEPPGKFETGTRNHEAMAGFLGVLEYLDWLGLTMGWTSPQANRRVKLHETMASVLGYERRFSAHLLKSLQGVPGLKVWGITDLNRLSERVPTVTFTCHGKTPLQIARALAAEEINVWSGHYYAIEIMQRLGLMEGGGMVRVGLVHYNTQKEVDRMTAVLKTVTA